jgi:hypothetical protein
VFTQQPHSTTAGQVIAPAVTAETLDRFGNAAPTPATTVDITLLGSASGAVLGGHTSEPSVNGLTTFADLVSTTAGLGYRLHAAAGGLTPATSDPFDIRPAAPDHLAFTQEPRSTAVAQVIDPPVVVQTLDQFGNATPAARSTIDVALQSSSAGAALRGTTSEPAVNGLATFADLTVSAAGRGDRLRATSSGLTAATSGPFDVRPGPPPHVDAPDHLVFTEQPRSAAAGEPISPAVVVQVQDRLGNVGPAAGISVDIALVRPSRDPALEGTTSVSATLGVASFADLAVRAAGRGYRLRATSGTLAGATSDPFDVTTGGPARLAFISQPGGDVSRGSPFPDQPRVAVQDAFGNRVVSDPTVVLGIATDGGVAGARLTCTGGDSAPTVAGVASFTGCAIDKGGAGYRLIATSDGVDRAESDAFDVAVAPPPPPVRWWYWALIGAAVIGGALLVVRRLLVGKDGGRGQTTSIPRLPQPRPVPRDGPWQLEVTDATIRHSVRVGVRAGQTTVRMQEVRR